MKAPQPKSREKEVDKVTLADVASPNPSPEAQTVVDRAIRRSIEDQNKVTAKTKSREKTS